MRGALHSLQWIVLLAAAGRAFAADPLPSPDEACAVTVEIASPENFYPPGPTRRQEEGKVVIEFTAEPGVLRARGVQIAKSSGFPDLDAASLRIGAAMHVTSLCSERRARFLIEFILGPEAQSSLFDHRVRERIVLISPAEPAG